MPALSYEKGSVKYKILNAAAKLFLSIGFERATIVKIADTAEVSRGSVCFAFRDKEAILCELVAFVIEGQFEATRDLLTPVTDDPLLLYCAETVLQLHLAESSEHMREMYNVSYSMPHSADVIFHTITGKLEQVFRTYCPTWQTRDFYEREIASAGIMRNYMSVPCDMYFTMERKIRSFLEASLLIYHVPEERIAEVIQFVSQYDWTTIADGVISRMLSYLESRISG